MDALAIVALIISAQIVVAAPDGSIQVQGASTDMTVNADVGSMRTEAALAKVTVERLAQQVAQQVVGRLDDWVAPAQAAYDASTG